MACGLLLDVYQSLWGPGKSDADYYMDNSPINAFLKSKVPRFCTPQIILGSQQNKYE